MSDVWSIRRDKPFELYRYIVFWNGKPKQICLTLEAAFFYMGHFMKYYSNVEPPCFIWPIKIHYIISS